MKTISIIIIALMVLFMSGTAFAQGCGPSCPVCSGAGNNDGALLGQGSIMLSAITIPDAEEEQNVINSRFGILKWLDAGLGYVVETEKVLWSVRVQPLLEIIGSWQPGIIVGSGSVQTGGSDQSVFVQLIKTLPVSKVIDVSLSAGVATLVPDFEKGYSQAGITTSFFDRLSVFANYDGESYHEGISWTALEWFTLSFLMVETEYPAVSLVLKYNLFE